MTEILAANPDDPYIKAMAGKPLSVLQFEHRQAEDAAKKVIEAYKAKRYDKMQEYLDQFRRADAAFKLASAGLPPELMGGLLALPDPDALAEQLGVSTPSSAPTMGGVSVGVTPSTTTGGTLPVLPPISGELAVPQGGAIPVSVVPHNPSIKATPPRFGVPISQPRPLFTGGGLSALAGRKVTKAESEQRGTDLSNKIKEVDLNKKLHPPKTPVYKPFQMTDNDKSQALKRGFTYDATKMYGAQVLRFEQDDKNFNIRMRNGRKIESGLSPRGKKMVAQINKNAKIAMDKKFGKKSPANATTGVSVTDIIREGIKRGKTDKQINDTLIAEKGHGYPKTIKKLRGK